VNPLKIDRTSFLVGLLIGGLLVSTVVLILFQSPFGAGPVHTVVHTVVLKWGTRMIGPNGNFSGYVGSWTPGRNIMITAVYVWMGNPSTVRWEGDVYLALNNEGDFASPDQVIVHYQFDKHAPTSQPHQQIYYLAQGDAQGFNVPQGQTVWVWTAFINIDAVSVTSGDGQVIIYYRGNVGN
jgi:hypothetical protein